MSPARVLEAVPNFSEGRDSAVVEAIVDVMRAAGADVLDWSADADHHRSVVTVVGSPKVVEAAALAAARAAIELIDLRRHQGVHPRIGALDVLPFVPLVGLGLADARASARRVGARIARDLGVPVYYYGDASDPPGRRLAELRQGGFEAIVDGWPADRVPDELPPATGPHRGVHATAGAVCVGARSLLLAWNVHIGGLDLKAAREVAGQVRESGGGLRGVRALALSLPQAGRLQISMNMEDLEATSPMLVFERIEALVHVHGGTILETEVIGMVPDALWYAAAASRLKLTADARARGLSARLVQLLAQDSALRDE